jgi:hypothetical protein
MHTQSRATCANGRSNSRASRTARSRSSCGYFLGAAVQRSPFDQNDHPGVRASNSPAVAQSATRSLSLGGSSLDRFSQTSSFTSNRSRVRSRSGSATGGNARLPSEEPFEHPVDVVYGPRLSASLADCLRSAASPGRRRTKSFSSSDIERDLRANYLGAADHPGVRATTAPARGVTCSQQSEHLPGQHS